MAIPDFETLMKPMLIYASDKQQHSYHDTIIDGQELVELMIDHNVGVSVVRSVEMKNIDSDYFGELA
jgi:restriction system protein